MAAKRSLFSRIIRLLCWLLGTAVVAYLVLFIRFAIGQPSIRVNHLAQLNARAEMAGKHEIAWPVYRRALVGFDFLNDPLFKQAHDFLSSRPGDRRWEELADWLEAHQGDLALMRQGSRRLMLGFRYGPGGDEADWQVFPHASSAQINPNPPLYTVLLAHISPLHSGALALAADARLAREQGDISRALEDVQAVLRIAGQLRGEFLVGDLTARSVAVAALEEIELIVLAPAESASDSELQELSEAIRSPDRAEELISYESERRFLEDLVQRIYTDDGNGNGRITLHGMRFVQRELSNWQRDPQADFVLQLLAAPVFAANRKEAAAEISHYYDRMVATLRMPYAQVERTPGEEIPGKSLWWNLRYPWMRGVIPSHLGHQAIAHLYLAQRDALIVRISLERYRRRHGKFPVTVEELIPTFIPAVPQDRLSPHPLMYRLIDGVPVIYSVGSDGDDDGGRGRTPDGKIVALRETTRDGAVLDGDLVLVPREQEP